MNSLTDRTIRPRSQRSGQLIPVAAVLIAVVGGCAQQEPASDAPTETSSEVSAEPPADGLPVSETFGPTPAGKVLRHAVFFSFRQESTAEDIRAITDAFAALPQEIEVITDFSWGVNNSRAGLDDGFTHCFLLTFRDEAGRAAYLPHPAHKAFGDVLRGHNDQVFVIDYWGNDERSIENPLRHAVFFRFKKTATREEISAVESAFEVLPEKIDSIKQFEWGINNSPERHSHGFTHCFMITFDSVEGRDRYLPHPAHQAFVHMLQPVLDASRVLDFWNETQRSPEDSATAQE